MDNQTVAKKLKDYARHLEKEQGNLYRIKAYRQAAETIERLSIPLADLMADQGVKALQQLPGVGDHLALTIERLVHTGEFHTMTKEVPPADDVRTVPGIGPHLAQLLWEKKHIRSVDQLETALRERQLAGLPIGEKRRQQFLDALQQRKEEEQKTNQTPGEPAVAELLRIDEEYRRQAEENRLPTIAPHRFNPYEESWLPLYSTRRGGWKYRALFSNTALAHRLGQNRDWVVIYFSNDAHKGQRTIVTEKRGSLRGRRVVRGRERECRQYYQESQEALKNQ